ncbi:glycosyltransferase family 61 protein [Oscillatoria sp. FACHB-1407]|uniref:glycosyltransferase family 61 protein n=1 Tax=Oscillatoria sp. FACHB-1407 TaxID=2692847 RepID=UPI001687082E|nr:glycosyltransferase family 61 protein [Oscillatoria sp. FACHB-1407]MBD2460366.1 glycosyltransferase family 61 protein [Oscillatoria sp. FACHB-1407]
MHINIHPLTWLHQIADTPIADDRSNVAPSNSQTAVRELVLAKVFPEEYFVVDNQNQCIADYFLNVYDQKESIYIKGHYSYQNRNYLLLEHYDTAFIDRTCFLLGSTNNYYHFVFDCLPRLRFLDTRHEKILIDRYALAESTYHRQFLDLLGLDLEQFEGLDRGFTYICRELTVSSNRLDTNFGGPVFEEFDSLMWLRDLILNHLEQLDQLSPYLSEEAISPNCKRFFISRTKQPKDKWRADNLLEIEAIFAEFGFEIVHLEELSLVDQLTLFKQAEVVAGPHGSGFTNTLFAPANAMLIELGSPRDFYWTRTAHYLGQQHLLIEAEPGTEYWHSDRLRQQLRQLL